MTESFAIIFLVYLVAGVIPPTVAVLIFRVRFLGGIWAGLAVGVVAAFIGGVIDALLLQSLGDMIVLARAVDLVPPLVISILATTLFALISHSNQRTR